MGWGKGFSMGGRVVGWVGGHEGAMEGQKVNLAAGLNKL